MRGNLKTCMCILAAVLLLVPLATGGIPMVCLERESTGVCGAEELTELPAGPLETPQVEDRVFDVKIFGLLPILPQCYLRHIDMVSSMFHETSDNPASLYLSLELRDLQERTVLFEAVYAVSWTYDATSYATVVHVRPDGVHAFLVGRSLDADDDIEQWDICEGTFDADSDVLTWRMPKAAVGDPPQSARLENIHPHTHLRPTGEGMFPPADLFKDLSHNAKTTTDYTIKY